MSARDLPFPALALAGVYGVLHLLTALVLLKAFAFCFLSWGRTDGSGARAEGASTASAGRATCSPAGYAAAWLRFLLRVALSCAAVWLVALIARSGLAPLAWLLVFSHLLYLFLLADVRLTSV